MASTVKTYVIPFVSPVIVTPVAGGLPVTTTGVSEVVPSLVKIAGVTE